ncbi:carbon-monoxide dehydrogenase medium subunit [Georgenia soli]|uniref:Carbon-monoxide dehydrogenase medium subunit n=1 Tax=Georgenia soli TaxID=638953 RepID=A0A2A9ER88_9MICO|nr:xanthine dehydrogenase family protein subunit M [Georgenia soli]PFG41106.1 carbon-monoxide dehydrogenase medium subunit [Georgenia soli]
MLPFDYARPQRLDEAVALLAAHENARVLAGGTDLTVGLRDGKIRPGIVVDIKRVIELAPAVAVDNGTVSVSATTPLSDVLLHDAVRKHFPALVEAASVVGSAQIRHRATLAGNVCNASPAADTAPVLVMHDAALTVQGPDGDREIAVVDFIQGNRRTDLGRGELVTRVRLPVPSRPYGAAFERMTRRRGVDLATINVSCMADKLGVTFVLGAVAPVPVVVRDDSGALSQGADPADRAAALDAVADRATPISDVRASAEYRRAMVGVLLRRALHRAQANLATQEER